MATEDEDLKKLVLDKVQEGENLLQQVQSQFATVDGSKKLERRIRSEIKFLQKLLESRAGVKKEHILSSNLGSLAAVVGILCKCEGLTAVFKPFCLENGPIRRIEVDVVSMEGAVWHKAIARKAEALEDISKGRSSCGQKSVFDQGKAYLKCARLHPHLFNPPQIVFHFFNSISSTIALKLRRLGVDVEGEVRPVASSFSESDTSSSCDSDEIDDENEDEDFEEDGEEDRDELAISPHSSTTRVLGDGGLGKLFLDITCMVAYVSSMTNGGANYRFPRTIYNQQAEWERKSPAKPKLDALFQGKELVTCREALLDFQTLVERMGGPGEKERTRDLINRLQIVEDSPGGRVAKLQLTSNVKPRSRLIFSTADQLGIVIVTANTGFVRSAASQGMEIAHYVHEPRVLTEQQEVFSTPLSPPSHKLMEETERELGNLDIE
uniref:EOG090X0CWG n=1 Tax=Ceriodaphnia reticulata TaxID=302197 RepID=A0A4Y7LUB4_9CRUS|nr:EOG090X0CWG [Ceriodaphnia reticulata]SVE73178.1 EOG090X0CWG [Ceriodaphnia reticulata]